jgi:hypothetical protein
MKLTTVLLCSLTRLDRNYLQTHTAKCLAELGRKARTAPLYLTTPLHHSAELSAPTPIPRPSNDVHVTESKILQIINDAILQRDINILKPFMYHPDVQQHAVGMMKEDQWRLMSIQLQQQRVNTHG